MMPHLNKPLTRPMRDALISLLHVAGGRPPQNIMTALERRDMVCNGELTILGQAAAVEIRRTRDRKQRWKDRD